MASLRDFARRGECRIFEDGFLFAYRPKGVSERSATGPGAAPISAPGPRLFLHVLPGVLASEIGGEVEALPADGSAWREYAARRVQLFNLVEIGPGSVEVTGDLAGLMPAYHAELDAGILVSSSLRALLSCFPELVRPLDPIGVVDRLGGQWWAGTRTLHERVRRPPSGARLSWRRDAGFRQDVPASIEAPEVAGERSASEVIGRIREVTGLSASRLLAGPRRGVVPLSGGFDSRLIACCARDVGLDFESFSIGLPQHTDIKIARRVAKVLKLRHRVFEPRRDAPDRMDFWLEVMDGDGTPGVFFATEFLERGYPAGTPLLHGAMGNLITGSPMKWLSPGESVSREGATRAVVDAHYRELQEDYLEALGLSVSRSDLEAEVRRTLPEAPVPFQAALLWLVENRTRRSEASMLRTVGQDYRVGAPFYDREVIREWLSVPRLALDDRTLLRRLFVSEFPQVARLPHSEEEPTLLPNNGPSLSYLGSHLANRVRDGVARRIIRDYDAGARWYLWAVWGASSEEQRAWRIESVSRKRGVVGDVLGWDPGEQVGPEFWRKIAKTPRKADRILRSYHLLTEYCDRLQRTVLDV